MEFYLPSIFIIILAAIISFTLIPKFTPVTLAAFAAICLGIAVYSHYSLFQNEYSNMNWSNTAISAMVSPYLLIILVIALCLGYIIFLFSTGNASSIPMPSRNIPPPSTATNVVTREIGNGLVNTGLANVSPVNAPANTATRNALESALSRRV